jgi:putative ABC transport system permease protein
VTSLRVALARVRGWLGSGRRDRDLQDEVTTHLELLAEDYVARGLSREEARAAARRDFGGIEQVKEAHRDQRGLPWMDAFAQDLRYGFRALRRAPAFASTAIVSLALGIGATTAVFSLVSAVLLRPLAVADPGRLVEILSQRKREPQSLYNPVFEELRRRQRSLVDAFAVADNPFFPVSLDGSPAPVYVRASMVSGSYFSVLGLVPVAGRLLTDDDDRVGGQNGCAAVIGYGLWTRRFQRDPASVGRLIRTDRHVCTIVGVAPEAFGSHLTGYVTDLWLPLRATIEPRLLASHTGSFYSGVMGRLGAGVSVGQAETELTALYRQIEAAEPPRSADSPRVRPDEFEIRLVSGAQGMLTLRRKFGDQLSLALLVVGVVLLIASANVATLTLARGAARIPELATRAALGAGRVRLARQLATEGLLIAALGGGLGVVLASVVIPALGAFIQLDYPPIAISAALDGRVLAVAMAATMFAALMAAILPAVRLSGVTMRARMGSDVRTTSGRDSQRLTRTLVAAQVALSMLLVVSAGLLLRTMVRIGAIAPGFRPDHTVVLRVGDESPALRVSDASIEESRVARSAVYRTIDARLNALPGVRAASVSWMELFSGSDLNLYFVDADRPADRITARINFVTPKYFDSVGMEIVAGRAFDDQDRRGSPRVAVVNESFARRFFGGSAIGHRLAIDRQEERGRPFAIVGITGDSKYNDLRESSVEPMVWMPLEQTPTNNRPRGIDAITLRVEAGTEAAVAHAAEETLSAAAPDVMVQKVTTLAEDVSQATVRERQLLALASVFGGLALLLAAVGLYGILAYAVAQRTREIGIRLALGAQRRSVVQLVMNDAWRLAGAGMAAGVPLALAAGVALRAFLFGVSPADFTTLGSACVVLVAVAAAAAYVPARRAAAVDPVVALKDE